MDKSGSKVENEYITRGQKSHGHAYGWPDVSADSLATYVEAWCNIRGMAIVMPDVQVTRRARLHVVWCPDDEPPRMTASMDEALDWAFDSNRPQVVILSAHFSENRRAWVLKLIDTGIEG